MSESSETRAQLNAESNVAFRNLQLIKTHIAQEVLLTNLYGGYPIIPDDQLVSAESWYERVIKDLNKMDEPYVAQRWTPPMPK